MRSSQSIFLDHWLIDPPGVLVRRDLIGVHQLRSSACSFFLCVIHMAFDRMCQPCSSFPGSHAPSGVTSTMNIHTFVVALEAWEPLASMLVSLSPSNTATDMSQCHLAGSCFHGFLVISVDPRLCRSHNPGQHSCD